MEEEDGEEEIIFDDSLFINRDYELTTFNFGDSVLQLFCLPSASTDYDLTGQLVWPGAVLLNNYLSENSKLLEGISVIELGSGVGITGILCSRFCKEVVLTDHNDEVLEILKQNIKLESSSGNLISSGLSAEKLEWGNCDEMGQILQKYPKGFDLILGADICFQQSSVPLLFRTVEVLLRSRAGDCKFILAYVSRAKIMDDMVINEAVKLGMEVNEVRGTRCIISNLEGVIYEIILPK
ncbi:protein N-lysine methyltransferase METTL21A isoform X1 [Phalaenopsis equestris]|uniref:protein N-lysine methyltransferase METTL21A isoform X1 n=1 Tax=Phalaenopsis equestris TaxID=78828 RepID=UPI0009E397C8|nr:protein N-lysine methyltransferase METTL21A isoform X1 [Phalaenopsis equestris]